MIFAGFSACKKDDSETNGIIFNTLIINDASANLNVSNATEEFSFEREITVSGKAKYIVALDQSGVHRVSTDRAPLAPGDNVFYVFETLDDEITNTFIITIRRRPMYAVSFDADGYSEVQTQQIEENSFATEPAAPSRTGHTFVRWNYDFTQAVTQDTEIQAVWAAKTDTKYKTEYYLQNLENDAYTLRETSNLQGTTDTKATAEIKNFAHFTHKASATDSGNIAPDGSLVLKVYYTRDSYTVTFNGNGGVYSYYGNETQITRTVKYGGKITAPEFTRTGYTQNGWEQPLPETISENLTLTAAWQINQYTLTLVLGGGLENKTITQDYGSAIENIEIPEREGYDFNGWSREIPETMPAENIIVYANWNVIFGLSQNGDTIMGLTDYGKNKTQLVIPEAIDGVKITNIDSRAFQKSQTVFNEKDNLRYIGSKDNPYLFLVGASKNLATYGIDSGCKYIGYQAFYECSNLANITIPNSVTTIGEYAFYKCSGLTSVMIPDSVTSIGVSAFENCSNLTSVTIPNSVTSIGDYAFSCCSGLTSITIPNSVTTLGGLAFYGCSRLTYNVKGNLKYLGNSENPYLYLAGNISTSIIEANIDTNCRFIGEAAFRGCSGLTSITIPDSVTTISNAAFSGCRGLTSVTIGNGVISIRIFAFEYCSGLTKINFEGTISQWNGINKSYNLSSGVSSWCEVCCTDGTISLK